MNRATNIRRRIPTVLLALGLHASAAGAAEPVYQPRATELTLAQPPLPSAATFPVQLVLDDNQHEGVLGVAGGQGASQFLWFNRFSLPGGQAIRLEQIWVLFPSAANASIGDPVQIVVYRDTDHDPSNGATLITHFDTTIQAVNDTDFSIYDLPTPLELSSADDLLIGVIPRYIQTGITPPNFPAASDNNSTQGRAWIALWNGDPPQTPSLPPDLLIVPLDDLQPSGGHWMIRAFGSQLPPQPIPLPNTSLWLMIGLGVMGAVALRGRVRSSDTRRAGSLLPP